MMKKFCDRCKIEENTKDKRCIIMDVVYLLYINYHDIGMTNDSLFGVYEDEAIAEKDLEALKKKYPGADVFTDKMDISRARKVNDEPEN